MKKYPFIKPKFSGIQMVMLDVIIALIPLIVVGWLAFGTVFLNHIAVAIGAALLAEFLFSWLLLNKKTTIFDGSAVVTALLLVFTISPVTPWYVVAFGASCAVVFGKVLWGGLGKNRFNPALLGREFMAVFFASTMSSASIWKFQDLVKRPATDLFKNLQEPFLSDYFSQVIFQTQGAMGEYSIACTALGGFYLLVRNRISWHIPFAILSGFTLLSWLPTDTALPYSMGGILLGTLFMATDMPSSPTTKAGKVYYGLMIALAMYGFIKAGVRFEYMSYAILILNGFSEQVSVVFKPRVWGIAPNWKADIEAVCLLSLKIACVVLAVISLYYYDLISYVIYGLILYLVFKFNYSFSNKVTNVV